MLAERVSACGRHVVLACYLFMPIRSANVAGDVSSKGSVPLVLGCDLMPRVG